MLLSMAGYFAPNGTASKRRSNAEHVQADEDIEGANAGADVHALGDKAIPAGRDVSPARNEVGDMRTVSTQIAG